jgi:Tol biopolymer transport system component
MKWKILFICFTGFMMILFFVSCAKQPSQVVPVFTKPASSSSTPQPTITVQLALTPTKVEIPTPDLCAINPVPSELISAEPQSQNEKLIVFNSEVHRTSIGNYASWNYADIFTVKFDGSNLKKLTNYAGDDAGPHWSSDGKKILFSSDRNHQQCTKGEDGFDCKMEQFIMNPDGTDSRKLTPDLPYEYPGRSPDGKYVAYEDEFYNELRLQNGMGDFLSNIIVTNISGSYKRNITSKLQPGGFYGVNWSPSGKYFAFTGVTDGFVESNPPGKGYWKKYVYVVNADGSNLRKLPGGPFKDGSITAAWSPKGDRLAFLTSTGFAMINADGSGFVEYPLERSFGFRQIFWLDDNQHLVFTDGDDNYYRINSDFTNQENLNFATPVDKLLYRFQLLKTHTLDASAFYGPKLLSPDGKWIAYFESTCDQFRVINTETRENYSVLDGATIKNLTINSEPIYPQGFDGWYDSFWSPDSRQLLFIQEYRYGVVLHTFHGLFAINLDGTGLHPVFDDGWFPDVQP